MLPVLLFAATALLVAGCSTTQNKESEAPKQPKAKPLPRLDPPEDPTARTFLEKLRQGYGVSDSEINQGCHRIDFQRPGPEDHIVEAGKDLKSCEIFDFVLDRYAKYPELAESLTGKPIPWVLDDLNPDTSFDEGIRTQVKAAIAKLEQILLKQGLAPDSEAFQEKMAVGLFYFAYFPENRDFAQKHRSELQNSLKELRDLGLQDFENYLFDKKGLGIAEFSADAEHEANAIEALRLKKGWCTERSKVLFAVFRLAKLQPFFVYGRGWEMAKQLQQAGIVLSAQQRAAGHHFIGLPLGNRYRYFDLSIFNSKAKYEKFYRESLSHYLSADLNNQANSFIEEDKLGEAENLLRRAEAVAPEYFGTYANLTDIYYKRSEYDKALSAAQRSVALESNFPAGHYNLFVVLSQLGKNAEALKSLRKAIELSPQEPEFHLALGEELESAGQTEEAISEYRKALALAPKSAGAHLHLGIALQARGQSAEATSHLKEGLALDPHHPLADQAKAILKK